MTKTKLTIEHFHKLTNRHYNGYRMVVNENGESCCVDLGIIPGMQMIRENNLQIVSRLNVDGLHIVNYAKVGS